MVCDIMLEKPLGVFLPGEEVKGIAQYNFETAKTVRGVGIRITGNAKTKWKPPRHRDGPGRGNQTNNIHAYGHETYIDCKYYLAENGSEEIELPAGIVTYPFNFLLPQNIPSSFRGIGGRIKYEIKVTVEKDWQFDDITKREITILAPFDLNTDAQLSLSQYVEIHKTVCCLWCASGPLHIVVKIPVTGYVSGQSIPISAECENASSTAVTHLSVALRKRELYHTSQGPRGEIYHNQTIGKIQLGSCPAHESKNWRTNLDIPYLLPSIVSICGIINLKYDLHICAIVSGSPIHLTRNIDLIIGTTPLASFGGPVREVFQQELPSSSRRKQYHSESDNGKTTNSGSRSARDPKAQKK